jgi:hypothetical protein
VPLIKGKSKKSFGKNVETEMDAGKPQKQALAIAYAMKKKAKKYSEGGQITDNYQDACSEDCVQPCAVHQSNRQEGGFEDHEGDIKHPNSSAMSEDERKLNQHGEHEEGRQGNEGRYAEGGEALGLDDKPRRPAIDYSKSEKLHQGANEARKYASQSNEKGINPPGHVTPHRKETFGMSDAGAYARSHSGPNKEEMLEKARDLHRETLEDLRRDRKDRKFMAMGGEVEPPMDTYESDHTSEVNPGKMAGGIEENNLQEDQADRHDREGRPMADGGFIDGGHNETQDEAPRDMVGRIMAQRQMEYSKGGQVANNTTRGWKEGERRDDQSAGQYDDLVLRADDMEDADYTGANSGDELDSPDENKRRADIVSRIMASRRKKDKLPNPR